MSSKFAPVECTRYNVNGTLYESATEAEQAGFHAAIDNLAFSAGDLITFNVESRKAVAQFLRENPEAVRRVMNDDYKVVRRAVAVQPSPAPHQGQGFQRATPVVVKTAPQPSAADAAAAELERDLEQSLRTLG